MAKQTSKASASETVLIVFGPDVDEATFQGQKHGISQMYPRESFLWVRCQKNHACRNITGLQARHIVAMGSITDIADIFNTAAWAEGDHSVVLTALHVPDNEELADIRQRVREWARQDDDFGFMRGHSQPQTN